MLNTKVPQIPRHVDRFRRPLDYIVTLITAQTKKHTYVNILVTQKQQYLPQASVILSLSLSHLRLLLKSSALASILYFEALRAVLSNLLIFSANREPPHHFRVPHQCHQRFFPKTSSSVDPNKTRKRSKKRGRKKEPRRQGAALSVRLKSSTPLSASQIFSTRNTVLETHKKIYVFFVQHDLLLTDALTYLNHSFCPFS